jgi:nitroimidazol reductase NimA-like FMN-containing flavoprotein (pyridoxamine 5'-phosphate oxidase superfamily)
MDREVIPRQEALRLLASVPVGRIVFTVQALPAIQPVNFVLDDEAVVIRIGEGSTLITALKNAVVAFEADEIDSAQRTGWSVTITGRAVEIGDPAERARLALLVVPRGSGLRNHFIRIPAEVVKARRLGPESGPGRELDAAS